MVIIIEIMILLLLLLYTDNDNDIGHSNGNNDIMMILRLNSSMHIRSRMYNVSLKFSLLISTIPYTNKTHVDIRSHITRHTRGHTYILPYKNSNKNTNDIML